MKLDLAFSCDSGVAGTAFLTVSQTNKTSPYCSCFLVPFSPYPSLSLSFFFFFKKEPLTFSVKEGVVRGGGWTEERQGCRVSRAQCEQLRGVISQAGSPLSGPWLGRTGGAGEARASKGHQQVGGRFGGGHARRDRKGRCARPVLGTIHRARSGGGWLVAGEERSRVKLRNGAQEVEG